MEVPVVQRQTIWRRCHRLLLELLFPERLLQSKYRCFRSLLDADRRAIDLLTDLEAFLSGDIPADIWRIRMFSEQLTETVNTMVSRLLEINLTTYSDLPQLLTTISAEVDTLLEPSPVDTGPPYILSLAGAYGHPSLVGGKATNLSRAGSCGARIPEGFVITVNSYHRFIEENHLADALISRFREAHCGDNDAIIRITGEIQELIMQATVPYEIAEKIEKATNALAPTGLFAVRSSALAEDSMIGFAGQYASELNVPADEIVFAYKRVLAGKYCPRALACRLRYGLSDIDTAMAVLVVPMLAPRVSGVMYTHDPVPVKECDSIGVYAVQGLAEHLVSGALTPEKYHLSRTFSAISSCEQQKKCYLLAENDLLRLKKIGLQLEQCFGSPQDIEWVIDASGITILQSRLLSQQKVTPVYIEQTIDEDTLLYKGLDCAAPGLDCGPVYFASTGSEIRKLPDGAVVVTSTLRPAYSQFLDRIAAVIAENGSRACHFASVAREKGVPVLVGKDITLAPGEMVTVDAVSGRIFSGCIRMIEKKRDRNKTTEFPREKFERLMSCTTRLNLTTADDAVFSPEQCHSLHDIVRYCHEMSVREMFSSGSKRGRGLGHALKIETSLPLAMYVLDLDNRQPLGAGDIPADKLTSPPMQAFWSGLADDRITWDQNLPHLDWDHFDQISSGIFSLDSRILASYAITSSDYLHLDIRFGYHFSIVDALCSTTPEINYINFRFKGGGGTLAQQLFRLEFLDHVLGAYGFETTIHGTCLDASYAREPADKTSRSLTRLGRVLASTRLMDMRLFGREEALEEARRFLTDMDSKQTT